MPRRPMYRAPQSLRGRNCPRPLDRRRDPSMKLLRSAAAAAGFLHCCDPLRPLAPCVRVSPFRTFRRLRRDHAENDDGAALVRRSPLLESRDRLLRPRAVRPSSPHRYVDHASARRPSRPCPCPRPRQDPKVESARYRPRRSYSVDRDRRGVGHVVESVTVPPHRWRWKPD